MNNFGNNIEPHKITLKQPLDEQLLYKIISADNLIKSIEENYLYFRRVDTYFDDKHDGEQLELDRIGNATSRLVKVPSYTAENYYDGSRSRTYACCFSLENSAHIWNNYGNDGNGAICLVFEFGKLRQMLNQFMECSGVKYGDISCHQFFSINYGIVEYIDIKQHSVNSELLPIPIQYTYLKDKQSYENEKELRVSLSALGMGKFALNNAEIIDFPDNLKLDFNFNKAFSQGVITKIEYSDKLSQNTLNVLQRVVLKCSQ